MKPRPPYASFYRDRHGVLRWRFRKTGRPESQTKEPFGTPAWWRWYELANASVNPPVGSARTLHGSIDALAVAYLASSEWTSLRGTTQKTYKGIIDRFRDLKLNETRCGSLPVSKLEPQHLRRIMDGKAVTPAAANNLLKVLRVLLAFGVSRGWRSDNPASALKPIRRRSGGFRTWSESEIATFEARWPLGSKERLAFDLLLYTAQRSGDVRRMGLQHVTGRSIRVVQEKTDRELVVPIHPRLQRSIDAVATNHLAFIVTKHGQPYTAKGFSQWVSEAANLAGLPKALSAHGLRKAAARRLAEAGCSAHEIMSMTGHRSLKEVERYTQAAAQQSLAIAAMGRIRST